MDLHDIVELLQTTARSVGAEVTSPWFYLQLGLILAATGISIAVGAVVRAKVDLGSLAMGWPIPFRLFMRVLVGSAPTAVFAVLVMAARGIMLASTWPSRSYLLAVSAKLALAWLAIRLITSVIRNAFIVRVVSLSAWAMAALSEEHTSELQSRRDLVCRLLLEKKKKKKKLQSTNKQKNTRLKKPKQ